MCFRIFTSAGAEKNVFRAELAALGQKKNVFLEDRVPGEQKHTLYRQNQLPESKNTVCPDKITYAGVEDSKSCKPVE